MKKFKFLPELRIREYEEKVFLYNPWSDNILELNDLSWKIAQRLCKRTKIQDLVSKIVGSDRSLSKALKEIEQLKKELIKWGIIISCQD